jgi:hypothetical protein
MKKILPALVLFALLPFACSFEGYNSDFEYAIGPNPYIMKLDSLQPFYEYFINNSDDTIVVYNMGTVSCEYDLNNPENVGTTCFFFDKLGRVICPDDEYRRSKTDSITTQKADSIGIKPPEDFLDYVISNRIAIAPHDTLKAENRCGGWYGSLKKGTYKMTLYYYMDVTMQEFIGEKLFLKDKSKMPLGMYTAKKIDVVVE